MAKVTDLGAAKPDSDFFKQRGYTINLNPKPPQKTEEKKKGK